VLGDGSTGDKPAKLSSQAVVAAHDKDINSIAVAPNDTLICSGSQDRTARIWRLPELVLVLTLKGHKRGVWDVEFSPVDQCVLTTSGDKTIKIWALSDGSCLKTFEGHTASVLKCAFLTCGTQLISAGADGLVKLWTIKTSECVNTFDHHDDKIWALAVSPTTETLATGGGDSLINLWKDCTVDDEDEAIRKEEEEALRDQELSNALMDTNWVKAVKLAFTLQRPLKLFSVFTDLLRTQGGDVQLCEILQSLEKEHRQLLLEYIRDWNMKPKSCHIAQRVLFDVLSVVPPREILEVPGVEQFIEGIIPYAKRHLSRIDRLSRSTFLLDYTLARMSVLLPEENLASKDPSSWRLSVEDMKALPNASPPTPTNPHIKLFDERLQKKDTNENGYGSPTTPMKDSNGSIQNKGRQARISTASPERSNGVSQKNADDMVKTGGEIDSRLGVDKRKEMMISHVTAPFLLGKDQRGKKDWKQPRQGCSHQGFQTRERNTEQQIVEKD
jgi:U3 small nucleolar RNA-associated protein 13